MEARHPFAGQAMDELDYEQFNDTHLMPSLTTTVCVLHFLISLFSFIFALLDIQMEPLCQAGLATSAPINLPCLPWSVYAYSPDGFARERAVGRNTNVMGYPFLKVHEQ